MVIQNAVLNLNSPLSLAAEDRHVTRKILMDRAAPSRMGDVCMTTSVCPNSSVTFAAAWTLILETMALVTLDAASQV
ncbi:hypothetical protein TNCV_3438961 [Trichonephila clavipes]|nr:hypothetical protein TNCV_3438961 [Trichonephila clavipes]